MQRFLRESLLSLCGNDKKTNPRVKQQNLRVNNVNSRVKQQNSRVNSGNSRVKCEFTSKQRKLRYISLEFTSKCAENRRIGTNGECIHTLAESVYGFFIHC